MHHIFKILLLLKSLHLLVYDVECLVCYHGLIPLLRPRGVMKFRGQDYDPSFEVLWYRICFYMQVHVRRLVMEEIV